jgi:hypothetical protein
LRRLLLYKSDPEPLLNKRNFFNCPKYKALNRNRPLMHESDDVLKTKLNAETGRIGWQELQRHFARGVVINVSPQLDLVEVAFHFTRDNQSMVSAWLEQGTVARASSDDARVWHENGAEFWAIVVAPWVLVQLAEKEQEGKPG